MRDARIIPGGPHESCPVPRRGYVTTPTPIEYCPNFSKALGAGIDVYIKRDDMLPGTAGGNKTRKLDFCIAEAPAERLRHGHHLRRRAVQPLPPDSFPGLSMKAWTAIWCWKNA